MVSCILKQARQNFCLLVLIPTLEFRINVILLAGEPKIICSDPLFYFKRWLSVIYFGVLLFYPWDKRQTKFKGSNSGLIDFSGPFSSIFTGNLWHTEKITLTPLPLILSETPSNFNGMIKTCLIYPCEQVEFDIIVITETAVVIKVD